MMLQMVPVMLPSLLILISLLVLQVKSSRIESNSMIAVKNKIPSIKAGTKSNNNDINEMIPLSNSYTTEEEVSSYNINIEIIIIRRKTSKVEGHRG